MSCRARTASSRRRSPAGTRATDALRIVVLTRDAAPARRSSPSSADRRRTAACAARRRTPASPRGTSALSALIEAEPESPPMLVPIDAARPSRNSSSSSGVIVAEPPARITCRRQIEPRPVLSAGSSSDAGPDARDDVDERQLVIFHHEHHHAVASTKRVGLATVKSGSRGYFELRRLRHLRRAGAAAAADGAAAATADSDGRTRDGAGRRADQRSSASGSRRLRPEPPTAFRCAPPCDWIRRTACRPRACMSAFVTLSTRST